MLWWLHPWQFLAAPMLFALVSLAKHCCSQRGSWCAATRAEGAEGDVSDVLVRDWGFNMIQPLVWWFKSPPIWWFGFVDLGGAPIVIMCENPWEECQESTQSTRQPSVDWWSTTGFGVIPHLHTNPNYPIYIYIYTLIPQEFCAASCSYYCWFHCIEFFRLVVAPGSGVLGWCSSWQDPKRPTHFVSLRVGEDVQRAALKVQQARPLFISYKWILSDLSGDLTLRFLEHKSHWAVVFMFAQVWVFVLSAQ